MRQLYILILCLFAISAKAQRLTHDFQDTSLSEALIWINNAQNHYKLNFIFDELEDFTVTTSFQNASVRDAVRQVCGFYPMHLTFDEQEIYIECTQKADTKLSGHITNESSQPIAYASITLYSLSDSTFLTGGVSNEAGDFVIPCEASQVIARISCIGYKTFEETFYVGHVGKIHLFPDKYALKGVTVKGSKRLVYASDKGLIANVKGTPLEQFGSATEMLAHLPLMMSNGEIAGRGKPEIYINNKKVRDEAELDRLRADDILLAEIITNPGAEYGAEVTSVIRLKTIRKQGEGWSGNFSADYSQGEKGKGSLNAALNYRTRNGMDFFVKGNMKGRHSIMTYPCKTELITTSTWNYDENMDWHTYSRTWYLDLGWNWEISNNHSVGVTYTPNNIFKHDNKIEFDEKVQQNGKLVDDIHNSTIITVKPRLQQSINAYYVGEIGKWKIDFSADYYRGGFFSEMEGKTNGQVNAASNTDTKNLLLAEKLIITAPMPKGNLSFGEEASNVDRTSDYLQNGFSADNHIHQQTTMWSLFADYSLKLRKFTISIGVRWQNELNHYKENELYKEEMSPDYHVLIPNLSIKYQTGNWNNTLTYRSIRNNPQYDVLSSSINYAGKYEYRTGNPFLQPITTDRISWESQWKWIHIELQYKYMKNHYNDFHTAYDEINHPGVRLMDFRATPTINYYGLFLNASPKIGVWQLDYSAYFYFRNEDLEPLGVTHIYNGLCTEFNLDNSFSLPHSWMLNILASIEPYYESGVYQQKAKGSLDLRLSKQFLKDKSLRVALYAYDILHTNSVRVTQYNGIGYKSEMDVYRDQRRVGIDISWKFNATRSRYKGTHAGQSERNRL